MSGIVNDQLDLMPAETLKANTGLVSGKTQDILISDIVGYSFFNVTTATHTALSRQYLSVSFATGDCTITLPLANKKRNIKIKKTNASAFEVLINAQAGDFIFSDSIQDTQAILSYDGSANTFSSDGLGKIFIS